MAELGLCSRREADDWIAQGLVRVNGALVLVTPAGQWRFLRPDEQF